MPRLVNRFLHAGARFGRNRRLQLEPLVLQTDRERARASDVDLAVAAQDIDEFVQLLGVVGEEPLDDPLGFRTQVDVSVLTLPSAAEGFPKPGTRLQLALI